MWRMFECVRESACVLAEADRDGLGRTSPARDLRAFESVTSDHNEAGDSGHTLPPCIT